MRLLLTIVAVVGCCVFLGAQPSNASCISAITIPTTFQDCGSSVTEALVGDNIGDIVTENSAEFSMCVPNNGSTAAAFQDVWYRFVATNNTIEVRVTTPNMAGLNVVIYQGGSCLDRTAIRCGVGTSEVNLIVNTQPGLQYYIRVSGIDENDEGNFNLSFTYYEDCDPCFSADNGELVLNPLSNTGFYVCGSTVNMCFTMIEWDTTGSNEWIHSVVPEFGPGWDLSTLQITQVPEPCNGNGSWAWYPGGWTSCTTGRFFPFGFAFDSGEGLMPCGATANDGDPGNNWGDGGGECSEIPEPITFCWTLSVKECPPGSNTFTGEDLTVNVVPYSDGESGSWGQSICDPDTSFNIIAAVIVCDDLDPIADLTHLTCNESGDGVITYWAQGGLDDARLFDFIVRNQANQIVDTCFACPSPQSVDSLPAGFYTIETFTEITNCTRFI
ncbi:MAG: hypothetical protein AAFU03_14885, partial [Bacteroidota bacterium]